MATFDLDDSGLLERKELEEFMEHAQHDVHQNTKPRTIMVDASTKERFLPPHEGTLVIQLVFNPERDMLPRTSTKDNVAKVIAAARQTDNRFAALLFALSHLKLQVRFTVALARSLHRSTLLRGGTLKFVATKMP